MYDYEKFYKTYPVNQHDLSSFMSERHAKTASLCRGDVLDIACGTGNLADYYFGDYTGVDISEIAIKEAIEIRRKNADFFVFDVIKEDLNFGKTFDTIVVSEFLEHIEDDSILFEKIKKLLKPNGRLIITCPNGPRVPDPSHVRELTIPDLRKKLLPFGKVKFYNWPGAFFQIICTVDFGCKNDDWLSLVMIAKDEQKGIEKAILSAIDIVDNIVVAIDSRTTDKTAEIAKLYADVVKTFDWQDDFSFARNFAHEGVKTKFILFLDGHEYIETIGNLENWFGCEQDGLLVSVKLESGFTFPNPRIYKNGVKFEGKIHEKQQCKNVGKIDGFVIKHDRLSSQDAKSASFRNAQRDDMVPRLMSEELKQNPTNTRALFHLGLYFQSKGEFKKALNLFFRYLLFSKNKQERWFVCFQASLCHMSLNHMFRALLYASIAEKEMPNRWETSKLKALIFVYRKKWSQALEFLVDSFRNNKIETLYRPWQRDVASTWNLIGECFFQLRNFEKAHIAFDRASFECKDKVAKGFFEKRASLMKEIFKKSV